MKFVIYDRDDATYHVGGGHWAFEGAQAQEYDSEAEAQEVIDAALDPEGILHGLEIRLRVRNFDRPLSEDA